jgi:hypothetical protein
MDTPALTIMPVRVVPVSKKDTKGKLSNRTTWEAPREGKPDK